MWFLIIKNCLYFETWKFIWGPPGPPYKSSFSSFPYHIDVFSTKSFRCHKHSSTPLGFRISRAFTSLTTLWKSEWSCQRGYKPQIYSPHLAVTNALAGHSCPFIKGPFDAPLFGVCGPFEFSFLLKNLVHALWLVRKHAHLFLGLAILPVLYGLVIQSDSLICFLIF